jgi:hypothetical protein
MKIGSPWRIAAGIVLAVSAAALPALAGDAMTVGQFLEQIARHRGHDVADARAAADALAADGVRVAARSNALSRELTEGDVVAITRALGLKVTTRRPDAPFDRAQVDELLTYFSTELGATASDPGATTYDVPPPDQAGGQGPGFDPFSKGKGKGKNGGVTPSEP